MNEEMNIIESEHEILKKANERANLNIFSKADFSNFESIDEDSVMFIGYPKSWVTDPSNYTQKLNYQLSKKDSILVFEKYGDKILEKEKEIEIYIIDGNYTDDQIIDIYSSDQQISEIPNQKNKLKDLIHQVRIRVQPKPLPAFKDYDQKIKLLQKFQDIKFSYEFQQDLQLSDIAFQLRYKDLKKNEVEQFKISFEKYKILTDRVDQVFEQDKNNCRLLFENQSVQINYDEISKVTYIHTDVLKVLYQEYKDQKQALEDEMNKQKKLKEEQEIEQKKIEHQRYLEEEKKRQDEENLEIQRQKELDRKLQIERAQEEERKQLEEKKRKEEEENQKLQKLKNRVQQCMKNNFSKQEIYDACKDIQIDDFDVTLQKLIDQYSSPEIQLPVFQNYKQKKNLIYQLKEDEVDLDDEDIIINKKFHGISKSDLRIFKDFYKKNKLLTTKRDEVMQEELQDLKDKIQEQIQSQKLDFLKLQKQTLILCKIIEEIFDEQIQNISDMFLDKKDLITKYFNECSDIQRTKAQILKLVVKQDPQLKDLMIQMFRQNSNNYIKLKKIFNQNNVGEYLFKNEIEDFIEHIKNNQINNAINLVQKYFYQDPILVLKLYYYLNKQSENKQIEPSQQFQTMQIVLNKDYEIIHTSSCKNVLRVIQKAILMQNEAAKHQNNSQFEFQKEYEQRKLFQNNNEEDVQKFLHNFTKLKLNKYDQTFKQNFEDLIDKHKKLNILFSDYDFIEYYLLEKQGFEHLMKLLNKDIKDEKVKGLININDIETVSRHLKICIILHQKDMKNFHSFGEMYLREDSEFGQNSPIHIQCDFMNETFFIVKPIDLKIKMEIVDAQEFEKKYNTIFYQLPIWMRHFFGFKKIFNFIYDENKSLYDKDRIQILEDVAQAYSRYEKEPNEDNFKSLQQSAMSLQNSDFQIFSEWYEQIQINQNQTGKNFAVKYNFYQARFDPKIQQNMLDQIKQKFPDPEIIYNLEDFNKLSSKIDNNQLKQKFRDSHNDPESFVKNIFQQMFSFINRRENISQLVQVLNSLNLQVEISSRFLFSLVLQNSDINLRTRILHYQSEYFSVPLIMNSQLSKGNNELHYVPEIVFSMLEGFGIFNFALGKRCIHPTGKSQLLNDLLFPESEFSHKAFEQQDKNLFSSGQVDVFFEKNFDIKRNFVLMDGQGLIKDKVIESSLILSNILMIHFHHKDLQEKSTTDELINKIKFIKNQDSNIKIIFIIRDSFETKILKFIEHQNEFNLLKQVENLSYCYKQLQPIQNDIDICIQLRSMGSMQKMERIQELKPMLQIFYYTIQKISLNKDYYKFTKTRFLKQFIFKDQSKDSSAQIINGIIEKSQDFIEKVRLIKQNIFGDDALPLLKIKNSIRQSIINIRTTIENDSQIQDAREDKLENLKQQMKVIPPSEILILFKSLVQEKNSSIIFQDISKNLRDLTASNIQYLKEQKLQLIEDHKFNSQIYAKDEKNKRLEQLKEQLKNIENEIYQKSISLEYFWRCLIHYLEKDTSFIKWNQGQEMIQLINCIQKQIQNGDCFELIDGENLEFKGLLIKEAVRHSKNDKVIVVCVIGPQSSGKSTLLNFSFGTQFFTSTGRCTKGIYFTLQKFPDDLPNKNNVKWLIMLDTEGLQSPERIDDEYDRKIVLFAMLSSDVLIINSRGEINSTMINTLKVCCVTFDDIKQFGNKPEIIYTYGQNSEQSKDPFKNQVQELYQKVVDAKKNDSDTIQQTALDLLAYNDDKINVFGFAYKNEIIQKDSEKGLMQNVNYKINVTQFGVETAHILEIISKIVNNKNKTFRDIQLWISSSAINWDLIDRYSSSIIQFQNLEEIKNDKKIMDFLNNEWNSYIDKQKVEFNDQQLCKKLADELIDEFKQFGQESLLIKQNAFEIQNNKQKDDDLKKYVFDEYENWKQKPEQNGITVGMEKKYKNSIIAKNEVLKDQFVILLKNKIQENKLQLINRNGLKGVQDRAMEIRRCDSFKNMKKEDKISQLEIEFEKIFDQIIQEIKGMDPLEQLKKNYFNSLVKQFGIYNQFIQNVSDQQYRELDSQIFKNYVYKSSLELQNLLMSKFTQAENNQENFVKNLFQFNNNMIMQIPEDPKNRIFEAQIEENFLPLKNMINCNYIYKISSDLGNEIQRDQLYSQIKQILSIQKEEKIKINEQTFVGKIYYKYVNVNVDDEDEQKKQIKSLFSFLHRAGFYFILNNKYQELSKLNIDDIFKQFGKIEFYKYDKKSIRQENKDYWAQNLSQSLLFDKSSYKGLSSQIMNLFKSKTVKIQGRANPNESIADHQHLDTDLKNAVFISEPEIIYIKSKEARKAPDQSFKTFISPKTIEGNLNEKWRRLADIAFRQLNWEKIIEKIINSVKEVIGSENKSISNIDNKKQKEIDEILLYQLSNIQIKNLETNYLQTQLKSKINDELNQKLCLFISREFDAKISWSAILVSWIELYKKAENTCKKYIENLVNQKEEQRNEFFNIVFGETDEITNKNAKIIFDLAFNKHQDSIKDVISNEIIKKDLEDIKNEFDNIDIYNYLDKKYLRIQQYNSQEFVDYVKNPVQKFQKEVENRANTHIKDIMKLKREKATQQMKESLDAISQITNLFHQQSEKYPNWHNMRIENYFLVYDSLDQIINYKGMQDLSSYFSPVILDIIIKIIEGNFQLNSFKFQIKRQNGIQDYKFIPTGPLEIFADQNFLKEIKNIQKFKNQKSFRLLEELIEQLKKNQQSNEYQIFEINNFIIQMNQLVKQKQQQFSKIQQEYDEKYFNCISQINEIKLNGIGCQETCKFCGRKCEQQQHQVKIQIQQEDQEIDLFEETIRHSCTSVGHQMRVFRGGYFLQKFQGKEVKVPSLHTCDIIDPKSKIMINGQPFIWREVLKTQLQDWEIIYNSNQENDKQKIFDSFWSVVGKQYCQESDQQYLYRERINNIQELTQIHQSKIVVIALDGSGSMEGEPWDNEVHQAKVLIDFIQTNHRKKEKVRLVIIFFNDDDDIKEVYDDDLDKKVEDIWKFPDGGTDFDPPFKLGFQKIKQYIDSKDQGELHFFTDGQADYPHLAFDFIQKDLEESKQWFQNQILKLKIFIYCQDEDNESLESFANDLNALSQQRFNEEICKLSLEVKLDQLGELMIENFIFNN